MTQQDAGALTFHHGEERALPHTLSKARHLTLRLVDVDADDSTCTFELRNPEAEPDDTVGALIEQNAEEVEEIDARRRKFHLPEKAVPVDTSTERAETLHCRLHEKLQIGDRLWTITDIAADSATVTPGRDHEDGTLVNEAEDLEYTKGTTIAEDLNTIDEAL